MRAIIRGFVILSLLAALVYGGLRGFTWYLVKEGMDNLKAGVSQYADVSYGSIYSSPKIDGTVGVDRLVIRSKMTSDELRIQSIRVSFPDIFQLLTVKKGDMPNSMRASIGGLSIDLDSPLLTSISKAQKSERNASGEKASFTSMNVDALGCGSIDSIGIEELNRMGYPTLDVDIDMDYSYEKIKNLFNWNATLRLKDMSTVNVKLAMRVAPSDILRRRKIKPVIDFLHVDSTDAGYAALRNQFCAGQLNSTADAFIDKNIELLSKKIGASFPSEDVEAYKKVMRGEGGMTFEIAPKPGTDLEYINQYPLRDAIDIMGVKLTLDNHAIDFSKLGWGKSLTAVKEEGATEEQQGDTSSESAAAAPVAPAAPVVPSYHATSSAQLSRYVGYQARLKTRSGMLRDGVIENAEAGSITMRLRSSNGKGYISFPVAMRDIASAEVLY